MHELQVPTRRISVDVFLSGGVWSSGYLFHPESLYQTGQPVDIFAELNDARTFVPFRTEHDPDADSMLSKRHIVRVRVHGMRATDLGPGHAAELAEARPCTLLFDDGTRLTGRPIVESPTTLSRPVDKLNQAATFLQLVTDDAVEFVNTQRIVRVFLHRR